MLLRTLASNEPLVLVPASIASILPTRPRPRQPQIHRLLHLWGQ
jgi:hypothetical protein